TSSLLDVAVDLGLVSFGIGDAARSVRPTLSLAGRRTRQCTNGRAGLIYLCSSILVSVLARADGFVFPACAIAYLLLKRAWRPAICGGITLAATFGGYVLVRLSYYGYPLPNTYYTKVSGPLVQRVAAALEQLRTLSWNQWMLGLALIAVLV